MSSLDPIPYSDAQLRSILQRVKIIAMVVTRCRIERSCASE